MNDNSDSAQLSPPTSDLAAATTPLYVDLDGTLTHTDLLFESALVLIKSNLLYIFPCLIWLLQGRAHLKAEIAKRIHLDVSLLPYNETCMNYLRQQRSAGRRLILISASNLGLVQQVADHLGLFDTVMGSDASINLKASTKLRTIERDSAGQPFAYAGNSSADLEIWKQACEVIVVNGSTSLTQQVNRFCPNALMMPARPISPRLIAKALRLHQWTKNLLLFIPLLAAHALSIEKWLTTLLGFIAFGLCASATYVINDLLDLASDRAHPRKRARAFAAATLSIPFGLGVVAVLLPLSLWLAALTSLPFLGLILLYIAVTLTYSTWLKKVAFVDVLVLALLYTHRVLAGGVASGITVSNWLLAVSLFIFLSLALVKRCAELEFMSDAGHESLAGRGYRDTDLPYLISMGIASGFVAVMVLALYIDSQAGAAMYPGAGLLWLILPVMLFWIMRLWIKTARKEIHDDPLLFAITDPVSWIVASTVAGIAAAASLRVLS
ncbi:MAG: UbiA family prenyltransferase [Burkholderiaceae bacterium]|nr:MAG: UbiA family prenyltransferase [Burkholderiaceae bacterium]